MKPPMPQAAQLRSAMSVARRRARERQIQRQMADRDCDIEVTIPFRDLLGIQIEEEDTDEWTEPK